MEIHRVLNPKSLVGLSAETELLDDCTVAIDVLLSEVIKHTTTLTNEHLH